MSSKRRQRRNQCAGKSRHESKENADYAAYLMRRDKRAWLHAYKCRFCRHWHVGHTAGQRMRERVRRLLSLSLDGAKSGGVKD